MFTNLIPLYPLIAPFLLVLFRVIGLFIFVPVFSNSAIPGNVKVIFSLAITLCVWNVVPKCPEVPATLIGLVLAVAGEMTVGLVIGMMVGCVFAGIQLGAHLISQQMGLSLSAIYDPSFEGQSTVIEQIAFWIALVTFFAIGGHRELINAVVYSYQRVPMAGGLGSGGISPAMMLEMGCRSIQAAFHAGTRVAMPALVAFFISTLTGGLMSRSMPQMNLMTLNVHINLIVGFFMVMAGMAGWALVSKESFHDMFVLMARVLG
jgi:flagellar biosynthetic protein FliR